MIKVIKMTVKNGIMHEKIIIKQLKRLKVIKTIKKALNFD